MGVKGQLSRILNRFLTPVTHDLLPTKAAPGQLTITQIHQALHLIGQLPPRSFYLFGNPISHSPSPAMHNAFFAHHGLPHHYRLHETDSVEELESVLESADFGGASVTIPFKLDIIKYLDVVHPTAQTIGSVNTIVVEHCSGKKRRLVGMNTDWIGIRNVISQHNSLKPLTGAGVVFGAGGTSRAAIYALSVGLGLSPIYVVNRTASKIKALTDDMPGMNIRSIESMDDVTGLDPVPIVAVGTVPATMHSDLLDMAERIMRNAPCGVLLDMAYRPRLTPLIQRAQSAGWDTISGVDALVEQGLEQFRIWTGCDVPGNVAFSVIADE